MMLFGGNDNQQTELDQVHCVCFVNLCRQVTVRYEMMNYKVIPVGA